MYRHVDEEIGADTLSSQVLDTYQEWGPSLREGVWKHIWVVSRADDSSMSTDAFVNALRALNEDFGRLTVHAMAPTVSGEDCSALVSGAEAGCSTAYQELVNRTGGVFEPLCNYNVKGLFEALLDSIHEVALSCVYEIPRSPPGLVFERGRVNVDYDDGFGLQTIGYVEDVSECSTVDNGWYYDDPLEPHEISMCPQTCARFSVLQEASIEIRFGCATVPAG